MGDQDEFRIKAVIDASGATEGADQTVVALKGIKDATGGVQAASEAAAPEASKLVDELGHMRESQRVARDLANIMRGDVAGSLEGVTGLMRVLLATSSGFQPELVALAIVTSSLIGIIANQQDHIDKLAAARTKTDDLKNATSDLKDESDGLKRSLDEVLETQKDIEDSDKRQLEAMKSKQDEAKELLRINKETAIEKARAEYLAGNTPGMSDQELANRKKQFEATKEDITNQSTVATAALALENQKQDIAQAQKTLADQQAARAENIAIVGRAQDKSADGKNFLENNGIKVGPGPDGKSTGWATDPQSGELIDIVAEFKKRIDYLTNGPNGYKDQAAHIVPGNDGVFNQDADRARLKELGDRIEKARESLAQIDVALQEAPTYDVTKDKLNPEIKKQDDAIAKLQDDLAALQAKTGPLGQNLAVAQKTASDDKTQRDQEAAREAANQARELADREFAGQNKAAIEAQEKIKENKQSTPEAQAAADAEIQRLRNLALAREISEKQPGGTDPRKPLVPGEVAAIQGEESLNTEKGGNQGTAVVDKAAKDKNAATSKDLRDQIEQIEGIIDASGDKAAKASLAKIKDAFKGHEDAASQALELAQLLLIHVNKMEAYTTKTDGVLHELKAKVDRRGAP